MAQDEAPSPAMSAGQPTPMEGEPEEALTRASEALPTSPSDTREPAWLVEYFEQVSPPPEPAWDDPLFWGDEARDRVVQEGPLHPSGRWHVLQGWGDNWRSAIVCDTTTKHTVWGPAGAILIAWSPDGDQVGIIREHYTYNLALHRIVATRFQSEYCYVFERYTWPTLHQLGVCTLQMPTGWPILLTLWPEQQVAVFQWRDQGESGLEFIHLSEAGDQQLRNAGFPQIAGRTPKTFHPPGGIAVGTAELTGPAFSPSGRFIAVGLAGNVDMQGQVIEPRIEGILLLGEVLILDWQERELGRLAVRVPTDTMKPFITPDDPFDLFWTLAFLGEERIELTLANGTKQIFLFPQESAWIRPRQRVLDL